MREFNIGDKCRIRQWDDMAQEFEADEDSINCEFGFVADMRNLCGQIFTIRDIDFGNYYSFEGIEYSRFDGTLMEVPWNISGDMLELIEEADFEVGNLDELF